VRILVFSDSHGDSGSILKIMNRFHPDIALHLGDGIEDLLVLEKDFPHRLCRCISPRPIRKKFIGK